MVDTTGGRGLWIWPVIVLSATIVFGLGQRAAAGSGRYGETYCSEPGFHCIDVDKGDSWESLWPDETERDIVMRINRMNIRLRQGMRIAVPDDLTGKTYLDFSPYPIKRAPEPKGGGGRMGLDDDLAVDPARDPKLPGFEDLESEPTLDQIGKVWDEQEELVEGEKVLIYDPNLLAWAAYDGNGFLVKWGPGAGGKGYCPDVGRGCRTKTGITRIQAKRGPYARSNKYPIGCSGRGCAPVPFFMQFFPGYGFHASDNVPGYHASHGCVRLFYEDAKWLHEEFIEVGTRAIVRPY